MKQDQYYNWHDALIIDGFTGQPITPQPSSPFNDQNTKGVTITTVVIAR